MRNLKKFLALVLAMVMAFSLMLTVNATHVGTQYTDEDDVTPEFEEAMEVLTGMGVYQGDEEAPTFRPASTITRAETAALIYRLATGDTGDTRKDLYKDYGSFTDVNSTDWFAGYVGYCANAGYIKGTTPTTFNPYGQVTGYEVLAMVLRAVGYDKNGEFVGATWQTNVSALSTQLGILKQVKSTHYGDRLYEPSRRDVVASLIFEAAQIPMVNYTQIGGYNKFTNLINNELNPTLGYKNFGLTKQVGIIVGNQATGEDDTLLGVNATGVWTGSTPDLTGVTLGDNGSYVYASTTGTTTAAAPDGNVTLTYNFNSGLDLFGHKVNMWYDARSDADTEAFDIASVKVPTDYRTAYAAVDQATLDKTVWADDLKNDGKTANKTSVYSAAVAAGFSDKSAPAWESDRFCQIGADGDNSSIQSKVGMYRIISNNGSKKADVVISLNQEVARITQVNTTVKDGEYIYLGTGSSKFGDVLSAAAQGKVFDDVLAPGSDKTLGDVVTANQIVGTTTLPDSFVKSVTGLNVGGGDTTARTVANAAALDAKFCRYETSKLEPAFTGTVSTYTLSDAPTNTATKPVVKVVLTDSKSYDLSGITGANVNETNYPWNFDAATHLIDGALTTLTGQNTYAGVTYSFYLDEVGRFVGVNVPNDYEFLYTTFADYEIGSLGTGTIGYYAYGVNWDGEIVRTNNQVKSISQPVGTDANGNDVFDDLTAGVARSNYPDATPHTLAEGYNLLPVTLKDQGTSVVGNQIKEGANTRFMLDPNGDLTWYPESAKYGERFLGWWDANATGGAAASYTWTITSGDAANGFKRVYNHDVTVTNPTTAIAAPTAVGDNTDYLLTDETKFIVVTGSGTADLAVKTYTGLTELLNGGTSAEIHIDSDFKGDNVYFITKFDRFGNVHTADNHTIDTVILSNTNLTQNTTQSIFFSKPGNTNTGVKLAGNVPASMGTVNQYELYNNGVKGYYWVSDTLSTGNGTDANTANGTTAKGDFYTLTPIGEVNGQPIYKAALVTPYNNTGSNGAICNVDQRYDYIVVNDLSTAAFGPVASNTVKKVTGATVTQVYGDNLATVSGNYPQGLNISDIQTLNNAVSMGKAGVSGNLYDIQVAIVYDGVNVSTIYVTNIGPAVP